MEVVWTAALIVAFAVMLEEMPWPRSATSGVLGTAEASERYTWRLARHCIMRVQHRAVFLCD